mmetsp:Transcript_68224/g.120429  ORF Transcript_68224/g.120429 Transcript_68224/m.120429 type:complete len:316 (-) Transcript_68224:2498-3445(-)
MLLQPLFPFAGAFRAATESLLSALHNSTDAMASHKLARTWRRVMHSSMHSGMGVVICALTKNQTERCWLWKVTQTVTEHIHWTPELAVRGGALGPLARLEARTTPSSFRLCFGIPTCGQDFLPSRGKGLLEKLVVLSKPDDPLLRARRAKQGPVNRQVENWCRITMQECKLLHVLDHARSTPLSGVWVHGSWCKNQMILPPVRATLTKQRFTFSTIRVLAPSELPQFRNVSFRCSIPLIVAQRRSPLSVADFPHLGQSSNGAAACLTGHVAWKELVKEIITIKLAISAFLRRIVPSMVAHTIFNALVDAVVYFTL